MAVGIFSFSRAAISFLVWKYVSGTTDAEVMPAMATTPRRMRLLETPWPQKPTFLPYFWPVKMVTRMAQITAGSVSS